VPRLATYPTATYLQPTYYTSACRCDNLHNMMQHRLQKPTEKAMPAQVYTREPYPGMGTGFQMDSCFSLRLCSSWKTRSYPLGGLSRGTLPFWSVLSADTLS
jgi:hypothetical protein